MGTAVVLPAVVVHVQAHDAAALLDGLEVQPQTKYFLVFFQWETQVGFPVDHLETDVGRRNRQLRLSHLAEGVQLGRNV